MANNVSANQMTRTQRIIVLLFAVVGCSGLLISIGVKSIMDESPVVEPVVRMRETKEQFIERVNHENLNRAYDAIMHPAWLPNGIPSTNRHV